MTVRAKLHFEICELSHEGPPGARVATCSGSIWWRVRRRDCTAGPWTRASVRQRRTLETRFEKRAASMRFLTEKEAAPPTDKERLRRIFCGAFAALLLAGCYTAPPPCVVPSPEACHAPRPEHYGQPAVRPPGSWQVRLPPGGARPAHCAEEEHDPGTLDLEACNLASLKAATREHGAAGLIEANGCEAILERLGELGNVEPWPDDCVEGVTFALEALKWQRFGGLW